MNDGHPASGIGIFFIFILINAVLYAFGAAIQEINENTIEEKSEKGDKKSLKIQKLIENPNKLINSIHIATIIMNILVGAFLISMISVGIQRAVNMGNTIIIPILIAVILVVVLLVFGILIPKKIAVRKSEKWSYKLCGIVSLILAILSPFTYAITKISNGVLRVFGVNPDECEDNVTEEEIITMVNEGHEQGVLLESEAKMITNIFEFGDKEAQDIMTHRKNIIAIDADNTINQVFDMIIKESNTRFPVYENDIDNIIGILHFRDFVKIYADSYKRNYTVKDLKEQMLFEAHFIPETRNINSIFKAMQLEKIHMAIVVDEYGQTSGIVTMEDILEEIVGNIMDEYDEDEQFIVRNEDGSYIMEGVAMLDDIEDLLEITFDNEDFDTLNGFIIFNYGKIPEDNMQYTVEYKGYTFEVLEVENKTVKKVKVTKIN